MCLLLKQLMHNLLSFTILYFSSFDICLNMLHCVTVRETSQTSYVSLTLTQEWDIFRSLNRFCSFALGLVDTIFQSVTSMFQEGVKLLEGWQLFVRIMKHPYHFCFTYKLSYYNVNNNHIPAICVLFHCLYGL